MNFQGKEVTALKTVQFEIILFTLPFIYCTGDGHHMSLEEQQALMKKETSDTQHNLQPITSNKDTTQQNIGAQ